MLREQWAVTAGIIIAALVLIVGLFTYEDAGHGHLLPVAEEYLAGALAGLTASLAVQIVLNSRAATRRERHLVRTAAELRETSAELDRLARTDGLTGIANRRAFFDVLGVEFRRSRRYGRELSVLMLDLDHFKQVNDRWGHPFGDEVLRQTAVLIARDVRESDIVGRYGGEEFAVALPETGQEQAVLVGEKLRLALEAHEFRSEDQPGVGHPPVRLTISVGVASLPVADDQDEYELIGRADQALYEAKRSGRNRVVVFSKVPPAPPEGSRGPEAGAATPAGA